MKKDLKDIKNDMLAVKDLLDSPDNNILVIKAVLFTAINKLDNIIYSNKKKKEFKCEQFGVDNKEDIIEIR